MRSRRSDRTGDKKFDVAIDFSHADSIEGICRVALKYRQPLVIGTTGHSAEQREIIEKTARVLPIVLHIQLQRGGQRALLA